MRNEWVCEANLSSILHVLFRVHLLYVSPGWSGSTCRHRLMISKYVLKSIRSNISMKEKEGSTQCCWLTGHVRVSRRFWQTTHHPCSLQSLPTWWSSMLQHWTCGICISEQVPSGSEVYKRMLIPQPYTGSSECRNRKLWCWLLATETYKGTIGHLYKEGIASTFSYSTVTFGKYRKMGSACPKWAMPGEQVRWFLVLSGGGSAALLSSDLWGSLCGTRGVWLPASLDFQNCM